MQGPIPLLHIGNTLGHLNFIGSHSKHLNIQNLQAKLAPCHSGNNALAGALFSPPLAFGQEPGRNPWCPLFKGCAAFPEGAIKRPR